MTDTSAAIMRNVFYELESMRMQSQNRGMTARLSRTTKDANALKANAQ